MTDPQLRALLEERVADLTTTDLAGSAWDAGVVVRRRRRGYVAAAAAAAVVAAGLVVPALVGSGAETGPGPGPASAPSSGPASDPALALSPGRELFPVPCDRCQQAGPTRAEEAELPLVASSLPAVLDAGAATTAGPAGPASVAVGQVLADGSIDLRLLESSGWHVVDTSALTVERGPEPGLVDGMLAPDGRHLLVPQPGAVAVYDVLTEAWSRVRLDRQLDPSTAAWEGAGSFTVLFNGSPGLSSRTYDLPGAAPGGALSRVRSFLDHTRGYGTVAASPSNRLAQSATSADHDELLIGSVGRGANAVTQRLALPTGPGTDRTSPCCPVLGWLDDDRVVYVSRGPVTKLVSWDVDSGSLALVSELRGVPATSDVRIGVADLAGR